MVDKFKVVLFSYIPLVFGDPTLNYVENPSELIKLMDDSDGTAKCAIWYSNKDRHSIAFAVDKAAEVKNHLFAWSEGKPNAWFDLIGHQKDGMYSLVLMPKLKKSEERWRLQYQLLNGFPAPKNASVIIYFKPLNFVTEKPSLMASNITAFKGKSVDFGFVDTNQIQDFIRPLQEGKEIPEGLIHKVSTFKLKNETNGYMDSMISGATENFRKLS